MPSHISKCCLCRRLPQKLIPLSRWIYGTGNILEWMELYYNIFIFAPHGIIVMCMLNCPGFMHDCKLAAIGTPSICMKIDVLFEQYGTKCVMDSAFSLAGKNHDYIHSNRTSNNYSRIKLQAPSADSCNSCVTNSRMGNACPASSICMLESSVAIQKRDEQLRGFLMIIFLYNFSTNHVNLNQVHYICWKELYGSNYRWMHASNTLFFVFGILYLLSSSSTSLSLLFKIANRFVEGIFPSP